MGLDKIAIFLRTERAINCFRDIIIETYEAEEIDEMILCSGFYQHDDMSKENSYKASNSFRKLTKQKKLILVGTYKNKNKNKEKEKEKDWNPQFYNFCKNMDKNNVILDIKLSEQKTWHAKIMIAYINNNENLNVPVISIIGSSNLTRPAFGDTPYFNYECDVVFWDSKNLAINDKLTEILSKSSAIVSDYNPSDKINKGMSLENQVKILKEKIFNNIESITLNKLHEKINHGGNSSYNIEM